MLAAGEFAIGTLAEAAPGTLVLPRTKYESTFLVGERGGPVAMFLDGDHCFSSFPTKDAENWKGLLISGVELIVDHTSLFDPENERAPFGSIVRGGTYLAITAMSGDRYGFQDAIRINLRDDLPRSLSNLKAGFLHWQLVRGSRQERQVLFEMDLREKA